jgi:hypothetical protein
MGLDFLDVAFEIEKQFSVRITPADLTESPEWDVEKNDCTAGGLHRIICQKCEAEGIAVPGGSWNRMRIALMKSAGVDADEVKEKAWLIQDLDMG